MRGKKTPEKEEKIEAVVRGKESTEVETECGKHGEDV